MKRKTLCLLLCIAMVFSLFPVLGLGASAEDTAFDYAVASDPTGGSWTVSDINSYESNGNSADQYALGYDLYYQKDGVYYPVDIASDPEYYYYAYSGNSLDIYGNFTADSPATGRKTWGHDSQAENSGNKPYYYRDDNDMAHKLYYNQEGDAGAWRITIFFYDNYEDKEAAAADGQTVVEYVKSTRDSSDTWNSVRTQSTVSIVKQNGSPSKRFDMRNSYDQSNSHDEWEMAWATYGLGHVSDNYEGVGTKKLYFKDSDASKKAIIYTDEAGTQLGYIAQNKYTTNTSATSPGNATTNGPLYYKRDLSQVPLIDPDVPTPDPGGDGTVVNPPVTNDKGFKLSKALEQNSEGSYDLKMQSYSTANTVKIGLTEKVPTDFVVVVDQSGSMDTKDMATGYSPVAGSKTLEECATGNYYYKDGDNYYRVYGTKDYLMEYHPSVSKWTQNIINDAGYDLSWFQGQDETSFSQQNQYYYKTADGIYRPVHVTATGKVGTYYIKFYYEDANGDKVYFTRPSKPVYKNVFGGGNSKYDMNSLGYSGVNAAVVAAYPDKNAYTYSEFLGVTTGMYINYPMYTRHLGYSKLCYRDVDGVEHLIGPQGSDSVAEYCNSSGQATTNASAETRMNYTGLYQATGTETRLEALKGALNEFVEAVAAETDTQNGADQPAVPVDNRIAIVGFSSQGYRTTEVITGNNVQMSNATNSDYRAALISANNGSAGTVNPALTTAIESLEAYGGTQPEFGFQMAKSIYDNRSGSTYKMKTGDKSTVERNKIVIFFTDGQPGDYHVSNQYSEANDVVASALPLKTSGAKVFSIGVFGESDGNPLTYSDRTTTSESETRDWKYLGGWMETYVEEGLFSDTYYCLRRQWRPANATGYTETANDTIFDYMSVTSSNYPQAENYIAPGWLSGGFSGNYIAATEGVRHKNSAESTNKFYRMAANQDTLVEAFKQSVSYASTQQQHTDVVKLDTTAVFRDVINTEDFDISNATYSVAWQPITVTGTPGAQDNRVVDDDSKETLVKVSNQPVPENGIIEYRGFDYGANFVTNVKTEGYKLVVTVTGLVPTTYNQTIASNVDPDPEHEIYGCGIYQYGSDEAAYSVQSPTVNIPLIEPENRDVDLKKTISNPATDGSYTITLHAYAKGNSSGQTVPLDKDTYLQDKIDLDNLALRSDLSEPIVKVYTLKGVPDGQDVTFENDDNREDITDKVDISYDDTTGTVNVKGFDYNANYIGNPKPMSASENTGKNQGKKIIVTIGGLVPTHAGVDLTSNDSAGVYDKNDALVKDVESPLFTVGSNNSAKTYVIDFSAPMTVATDATTVTQTEGTNGIFSLIGSDVVYQLSGSPSSGNLVFNGVDKAFAHAKLARIKNAQVDWCTITTVPAGSVYFDDDFAKLDAAINVGDGSGWNSAVTVSPSTENTPKGQQSFTFYGTGIDIYCTTDHDGGYVQARLTQNGTAVEGQPNQTVKNYTEETERYNVPSVSFTGLKPGEYTVTLNILGSSNYKLDGVRVYNPISDQTQYTGDAASEKYATYINMREALVNNAANTTINDNQMDDETVVGALFVDDSTKLSQLVTATDEQIENGKGIVYEDGIAKINVYANQFDAYKANSPKHEIYLKNGQAVVFQLSEAAETAAANGNLWIGLSAPDKDKNTGTVTLKEGKPIDVTSGVDMYYPITGDMIGADRVVTLRNTGANMISVTNLKITGNEAIYIAGAGGGAKAPARSTANAILKASPAEDVIPMVFEPVTMRTVMLAANNGLDPDAVVEPGEPEDPTPIDPDPEPTVTPDPTPTPGNNFSIVKVVSSIVKSLLKSISRLFGR